ncbi:MAG TPA: ABC transporter permease [Dehalococcoidia bacterium]|jgi:oligopeptide transport system permease protein|nr:ABC transporter permease [Dehalococcoidia bacterium]
MLAYTVRRILWIIPVLWAIATLTFFMMKAIPGGPFVQDKTRPESAERAIQAKYGFDQPIWEQYGRYMWNLLHFDLGISFFSGNRDVVDIIRERGFISLQIAVLCMIVAVTIGLVFGTISALNHNGPFDYAGVLFATIGASVPHFVLGALLSIIFAVKLGWLKILGWGGPERASDIFNPDAYDWTKMIIPVVALSMLPAAYIARVTRASMLEVLNQDYIRTARAKGLAEQRVVVRHAIKNAMIPVLTVIGPIAAILLSGSFIIETMFGISGLGRESIMSIQRRDYGVIMGTTLVYALIVSLATLFVDLMYAVVDPRIRYR